MTTNYPDDIMHHSSDDRSPFHSHEDKELYEQHRLECAIDLVMEDPAKTSEMMLDQDLQHWQPFSLAMERIYYGIDVDQNVGQLRDIWRKAAMDFIKGMRDAAMNTEHMRK